MPPLGVPSRETTGMAVERMRSGHSDGCGASHLGMGFPGGHITGQDMAWTVPGGSATSLVNAGPVPV